VYTIQKSLTDAHIGVDAFGSEVSSGGTCEEAGKVSAGKGTESEKGTDADVVPVTGGEKYETDSKNVTSADTKYFLVERL